MSDFAIQCQWKSALHEAPEIRETSAMLKILLGNTAITRNEDVWSQTVSDDVRLSAYPLAMWFAAAWWRLRWEPLPASTPSHAWRMAHELAASGHGYLWPRMLFASDGEIMQAWAVQSAPDTTAAIRYLLSTTHTFSSADFEYTVDTFIDSVIARLNAVGIETTALHELWQEVIAERNNPEVAAYRRLEAMLGFDPDECPELLHNRFSSLVPQAGADAIAEIAPLCATSDPGKKLDEIVEFSKSAGLDGRIELRIQENSAGYSQPWQRGKVLAQQTREHAGLGNTPVGNAVLCDLLGISQDQAINIPVSRLRPLGMAIRRDGDDRMTFLLSKSHSNWCGRRFELARLLGDHLIYDAENVWLPATKAKTARQKTQRAFAAELLCPIDVLKEYLDGDFSDDAMEDVAESFGVSTKVVETQLVNHQLLPSTVLGEGECLDFPYALSSGSNRGYSAGCLVAYP